MEQGKRITSACINSPYVILLLNNKSILAYEADVKSKDLKSITLPKYMQVCIIQSQRLPYISIKILTIILFQDLSIEACFAFLDQSHTFASIKDLGTINAARKGSRRKRKNSVQLDNVNKKANRSPSPGGDDMDAIDMDLYGSNADDVEEDKTMTEVNSRPIATFEEDKDDDDSMGEDDDLYMSAPPQVVPQSDELIDESNVSNLGGLGVDTESTMWCQIYCTDGCLKVCAL
jgi:hypothetical protein